MDHHSFLIGLTACLFPQVWVHWRQSRTRRKNGQKVVAEVASLLVFNKDAQASDFVVVHHIG